METGLAIDLIIINIKIIKTLQSNNENCEKVQTTSFFNRFHNR